MRDLIVALFALCAIPVAFKRPAAGMLAFSLFAYMRVQDLAWGFAKAQRWSMFLAVAMIAGWAFQRGRKGPIWNRRTWMLVFMPAWTFLGLVLAIGVDAFAYPRFIEFVKIIFVGIFTTMIVQRREHLRALMWIIGISFAFFGVKNGLGVILSGGSPILRGPGGMLLATGSVRYVVTGGEAEPLPERHSEPPPPRTARPEVARVARPSSPSR